MRVPRKGIVLLPRSHTHVTARTACARDGVPDQRGPRSSAVREMGWRGWVGWGEEGHGWAEPEEESAQDEYRCPFFLILFSLFLPIHLLVKF
jgi:hypothetical protein